MPWEMDLALLNYTQLKKSKYYLDLTQDNIYIDSFLNLSSNIINWEKSQLPKEFFKRKFNDLAPLLKDFKFRDKVYEGDELYGHLDTQKEIVESHIDYYITICPDMYFDETTLYYLIEGSKQIKNKYFVLTPQISKMWDYTWDEITNKNQMNIPYDKWNEVDIFDIRYGQKINNEEPKLVPINKSKWAGWCDVQSKVMYEKLCPIWDIWKGYGGHDYYSMMVTEYVKNYLNYDFQQWIIENKTVFEYSVGSLKENGFSKYYKDFLVLNNIPNQRQEWDKNVMNYVKQRVEELTLHHRI